MSLMQMSLMGSAMIVCALLLRAAARGRLPAKVASAMWMAALLRLLVPVTIPSSLSILGLFAQPQAVYAYTRPAAKAADFSWLTVLWLFGAAACALTFLTVYLRQRRVFQTALPAKVTPEMKAALSAQGLSRRVTIHLSDRISTPLTYGVIRPSILLPSAMEAGREELNYVIAHECGHIRRGDAVKRLLLLMAVCLHWFNPLVWLMAAVYRRDMEQACDHHVLEQYGPDARASYARALLDLEERKRFTGVLFECFSQSPLEERIRSIMAGKKGTLAGVLAAVAVYGFTAAVFATSPGMQAALSSVTVASMPSAFYSTEWVQAPETTVSAWGGNGLYTGETVPSVEAAGSQGVWVLGVAAPTLSVTYAVTAPTFLDQSFSLAVPVSGSGAYYSSASGVMEP